MKSHRWLYPLRFAVGVAVTLMGAREAAAQGTEEADLSVEIVRGPRSIDEGDRARYRVRVENDGPDDAEDVNVIASVSPGLRLTRVRCRGIPEQNDTCVFHPMRAGRVAYVVFEVEADDRSGGGSGDEVLRVSVSTDTPDPNEHNDRDQIVIEVDDD